MGCSSFIRRILFPLGLSLAAAGVLGAQERIVFTPQSGAQAQFAGYYVALERGFYAEEGLDVEIVHPFATHSAVDKIREGECTATTLPLSLAMRTIDGGLPLVNILQTSMNSATVILSRWGDDPLTLHGAKVATFRAGFGQLARSFAETEHLDYEWIVTASAVNLFVVGAVDATLGRSYDEYYRILQTGLFTPGKGIYRFEDGEYNIQQEGVYVSRGWYERHKEQAEAFARASRRGWEWAAAHPDEAVSLSMRYVLENWTPTNGTLQKLMLQEVLRLQLDHDSGRRAFRLRPDMVEKASRLLREAGVLSRDITMEDLLP
ncbi:MAG: ABC transporter substrate-binding protein [Bacteroidales bacterium]|nr:ABC transporter substrate-binding protein [Bacteroidales bacterium]